MKAILWLTAVGLAVACASAPKSQPGVTTTSPADTDTRAAVPPPSDTPIGSPDIQREKENPRFGGTASVPTPGSTDRTASQSKDRFVEQVENRIDGWERRLDRMSSGDLAENDPNRDLTAEERAERTRSLRAELDSVKQNLDQLKNAEGGDWQSWQPRIQAQLDSIEQRFGERLAD